MSYLIKRAFPLSVAALVLALGAAIASPFVAEASESGWCNVAGPSVIAHCR